jgi:hypothetical protein
MIITAQLNAKIDPSLYDREVFPISRSKTESELSPFFLGPLKCNGLEFHNVENAWQFSKVYPKLGHLDTRDELTQRFWDWLEEGANTKQAQRYPAGRNAKPAFSLYQRKFRLSYTAARKRMYIPMYANLAVETDLYEELYKDVKAGVRLLIRDYDAYTVDPRTPFQTCVDNPQLKLGHGMVLAEMLRHGYDLSWINNIII